MRKSPFRSGTLCIVTGGVPCFAEPSNLSMFRATFRELDGKIPAIYHVCAACGQKRHSFWAIRCFRCGLRIPPAEERIQSATDPSIGKSETMARAGRYHLEGNPRVGRSPILEAFAKAREVLDNLQPPKTIRRAYDPVRNEVVEIHPNEPVAGRAMGIDFVLSHPSLPGVKAAVDTMHAFEARKKGAGGSAIVQASIGEKP